MSLPGPRHRERVEDALKHLLDREERGERLSPFYTASALGVTASQAEELFQELCDQGFLAGDPPSLTAAGRQYAARVVRTHRLFETHLARSSGLGESEWHRRAHAAEHRLTPAQTEALAAAMGQPVFDPHGDPIPSPDGRLPPRRGQELTGQPAGWSGRVTHVEDEPAEAYRRLAAEGFAPGCTVRVDETGPAGVRLRFEGRDVHLSTSEARQLTVEELPPGSVFDDRQRRLSDLQPGERAEIAGLSPLIRGLARDRLLNLGFVPGTAIEIAMVAPSGDPVAYRVRGAVIALRRAQAERVLIRPAEGPP